MTNKKVLKSKNNMAGAGAGLAAAGAVLMAGYYFYVSKNAKRNRKIVGGWAVSLKNEVLEKAEQIKDNLNKESLIEIIDDVASNYYSAKNATKEEVQNLVNELKENWSSLLGELNKTKKVISKTKTKFKN